MTRRAGPRVRRALEVEEAPVIITRGMVAFSGEDKFLPRDIRFEQGRIVEIGSGLAGPDTPETLDAEGRWVFPGGIDPHVHFYDPGYTEKEDFAHGTAFAAQGGITTIIDMPCTSNPPVSEAKNLQAKLDVVGPKAVVDYGFHGGISRQLFDAPGAAERLESLQGKVTGIKSYAVSGVDDEWGALDPWRFQKVLEMCRELGIPALLHAEDRGYVDAATADRLASGRKDPRAWYEARPELAEILSFRTALRLAEETGADLHIVHIGTGEAGAMLTESAVTGETCPQYLAFTVDDFSEQGAVLKIAPPIKSEGNPDRLWQLLADGTLDFIASDHAPGTAEEKSGDDIWTNSAGICGTGTILPYLLSEGYGTGRLGLARFLEVMSENASKRYGFWDRKGSIAVGKDADLVIVDPQEETVVRGAEFLSKGRATPFEGRRFRGKIEKTLLRGRVVYENGKGIVTEAGYGKFITPSENGRGAEYR